MKQQWKQRALKAEKDLAALRDQIKRHGSVEKIVGPQGDILMHHIGSTPTEDSYRFILDYIELRLRTMKNNSDTTSKPCDSTANVATKPDEQT